MTGVTGGEAAVSHKSELPGGESRDPGRGRAPRCQGPGSAREFPGRPCCHRPQEGVSETVPRERDLPPSAEAHARGRWGPGPPLCSDVPVTGEGGGRGASAQVGGTDVVALAGVLVAAAE